MTVSNIRRSNRIVRRAGHQGVNPADPARNAVEKLMTVPQTNLQRYQSKLHISTFNTRTLTNNSQLGELAAAATHQDIICIQERRYFHDVGNGWTLITSLVRKNSTNPSISGVGMLTSPKAQKTLNNIESATPRILVASFNVNPPT